MKLIIYVSISIFGGLGWWLGSKLGMLSAVVFSTIGSLLGLYVGVKLKDYLF